MNSSPPAPFFPYPNGFAERIFMDTLTLALDWTPNINHVAFFLAQEDGLYRDVGLDVRIVHPGQDDYAVTPAKKVETGVADIALCPTESVLSYRTKQTPCPLLATAALLQKDVSAIAVRSKSRIERPRQLDGRIYASYDARYEDGIVRELVRRDGGRGDVIIERPAKLGIWNTVLHGSHDATWIFLNWEGVQARQQGADLRTFTLADHDIPYSYSPVLAVHEVDARDRTEVYSRFLQATSEAAERVVRDSDAAVAALAPHVRDTDRDIDLHAALEATAPHMIGDEGWGMMDLETVQRFLDFLHDTGLEPRRMNAADLFSNDWLQAKMVGA